MSAGLLGAGSTIRTRIALVYGGVFVVLGGCLLTIVNLLSRAGTEGEADAIAARVRVVAPFETVTAYRLSDDVSRAAGEQMLMWSCLALVVMAFGAVVVGWWTAGRVLRPVHEMTERARRLSERNLHEKIGASGPDDELKELGDTIDALLGRLEAAFDSQRRFIANASHELRTPLATQRAAIQVGLDDANEVKQVLLDSNRRSERLIEGLLVLARSERGLEEREDVPLRAVVAEECETYGVAFGGEAGGRGGGGGAGRTDARGVVRGSRVLLGQLVRNLVANAVAYNVPGGSAEVRVDGGVVTVVNTGPVVPADEVPGLFEPFRRGEGRDRMGPGAGLGLSIVRSIAVAHGGTVEAVARTEKEGGGLVVTVALPVTTRRAVCPGQPSQVESSPR
ncbi:ATP-binding protein [Streptomyces sp. Je 1-79]|uniref:sensor histidine kinase n=1 Tax=Streptomyces sp. Je 1-79 TaxID=2943847 RepID=UPI0021A321E3|nr:ATP-binding protein [Streptomyces sp. Je 1-79]MCT4354781.1 ATP-binding protein [Streptomyces sp. Je 1-79]